MLLRDKKYLAVGIDGDGVGQGDTPEDAVNNLQDKVLHLWDGRFKIDEVVIWEVTRVGKAQVSIIWETEKGQ